MTDKERLEVIEEKLKSSEYVRGLIETPLEFKERKFPQPFIMVEKNDYKWLINQAKQNLSNDKQALIKANIEKQNKIDRMQEEIETLAAALYDAKHEVRVLKGRQRK